MDKTKEALYGLIRMALVGERPKAFPESVDWNLLYDMPRCRVLQPLLWMGCKH